MTLAKYVNKSNRWYFSEEVTKYYCYEAIPGTLVFSWESMPCTIYVGVIGALFLFLLMALVACCCKGSKKMYVSCLNFISHQFTQEHLLRSTVVKISIGGIPFLFLQGKHFPNYRFLKKILQKGETYQQCTNDAPCHSS